MRMNKAELLSAVRLAAKYQSAPTAKLMNEIANRLDVTCVALSESLELRKALAAENVGLKAGMAFFSYSSESGYEEHDTAEKAEEFAQGEIDYYREQAGDGWSDEVGSVVWGVVLQQASMTDRRPVTKEDKVGSHIEEYCDYTLQPNLETPATDRFVAEMKAQGVDIAIEHLIQKFDGTGRIGVPVMALEHFAKQLREAE